MYKRVSIPTKWQNSKSRFDVNAPNPPIYVPRTLPVSSSPVSPPLRQTPSAQENQYERDVRMVTILSLLSKADRQAIQSSLQAAVPQTLSANQSVQDQIQNLLHREITPEDYELLLLLDETVQKKTVSQSSLNNLTSVSADGVHPERKECSICLDEIQAGMISSS